MGRHNLQLRPVQQPGLLARLFGRPQRDAAAAEVWNLVATTPVAAIGPDELGRIFTTRKVRPAQLEDDFRRLYTAVLYEACRDDDLTDAELADVQRLRHLLALTDADVAEIAASVYKSRLAGALKGEDLSDQERSRLVALASRLRLPADVAAAAMKEEGGALLQRVLDRAVGDRRLAPEEEAQFHALATQLGITPSFQGATSEALDRFRLYWRIEQGDLPRIDVGLNLKRGEQVHFRTPA